MGDNKKELPPTTHLMVGLGSGKATSPILKMAFCVKAYDSISKKDMPEWKNIVNAAPKPGSSKVVSSSAVEKTETSVAHKQEERSTNTDLAESVPPSAEPKVVVKASTDSDDKIPQKKPFDRRKKRNSPSRRTTPGRQLHRQKPKITSPNLPTSQKILSETGRVSLSPISKDYNTKHGGPQALSFEADSKENEDRNEVVKLEERKKRLEKDLQRRKMSMLATEQRLDQMERDARRKLLEKKPKKKSPSSLAKGNKTKNIFGDKRKPSMLSSKRQKSAFPAINEDSLRARNRKGEQKKAPTEAGRKDTNAHGRKQGGIGSRSGDGSSSGLLSHLTKQDVQSLSSSYPKSIVYLGYAFFILVLVAYGVTFMY
jgi:hypothetical protein